MTSAPPTGWAGLLANDADSNGDTLYPVLLSDAQHGGLDLRQDGSFRYVPDSNFSGTDTFVYKASDGISDSAPVTVTIVVPSRQGIDLDGRDVSSGGLWMTEVDESIYGIGVAGTGTSSVLARTPVAPSGSGWQIASRLISWDPSKLSVGGVTSPGYVSLPLSGDQVLSVTAVNSSFSETPITYQEVWNNAITGTTTTLQVNLQAKPQTAKIESVEITSDHAVLLNKGGLDVVGKDAGRFSDIEWVRSFGKEQKPYNAPFSHSREATMTLKAKWSSAGIPINTPYQLEGTVVTGGEFGAPGEGFKFTSANLTTTGNSETSLATSTSMLSEAIGKWSFTVVWKVILNPGPTATTLELGESGKHIVYQTYATPVATGVVGNPGPGSPTVARMELATTLFTNAYVHATFVTGSSDPKPARLVFTLLKLHQFNGKNSIVHVTENEVNENLAWLVPKYWAEVPPGGTAAGSNCISGALFVKRAALMVGIPGKIEVKTYAADMLDPTKAVEILTAKDARKAGRVKNKDKPDQEVAMHFSGDSDNIFEATVVYTSAAPVNPVTFYMPSGVNVDVVYDTKDKVLTVFDTFEWAIKVNGVWSHKQTPDVIKAYTLAPSLPLTDLDN